MRFLLALWILFSIALLSSCKDPQPKTEDEKALYAMGSMFGQRLAGFQLTAKELNIIVSGMRAAANNEKSDVDPMKYQAKLRDLLQKRITDMAQVNKEKGKKFADNFIKSQEAKTTTSGLIYKVMEEGSGKTPSETDTVEVHYHGTLIDGTVFDSSKDRGNSVSFPLNRVIKGWQEGLQLIKEGGKIKLVIPSELAYKDQGAPPSIPGGATLVFDVELIKIKTEADLEQERKKNMEMLKDKINQQEKEKPVTEKAKKSAK